MDSDSREKGSPGLYALIVPGVADRLNRTSIFPAIYDHMASLLQGNGQSLMYASNGVENDESGERLISVARQVAEYRPAGIFFVPQWLTAASEQANAHVATIFKNFDIPVILIDRDIRRFPGRSDLDLVAVDNERGGYLATNHLIAMGCRRILFAGNAVSPPTAAREAGYRLALHQHGIAYEANWLITGPDFSSNALVASLRASQGDGIVCSYDALAAIVMQNLIAAGVRIPDDVLIAGFDNSPIATLLPVPLTTINQPTRTLAASAVSMMTDRLGERDLPPRHYRIDCELVIRASTGRRDAASPVKTKLRKA